MKISILYSGGLDSFLLWQLALRYKKDNPDTVLNAVWYDIGQGYVEQEEKCIPFFVDKRKIDWLGEVKGYNKSEERGRLNGPIYIPGRNAILSMLTASIYLSDEVWLGTTAGETDEQAYDKNFQFLEKANNLSSYIFQGFGNAKIRFPFAEMKLNKTEMISDALDNNVHPEMIKKTWSCHRFGEKPCGECVNCFRRFHAFQQNGLSEEYEKYPPQSKMYVEHMKKLVSGERSHHRYREVVPFAAKVLFNTTEEKFKDFILRS
jgi:hypothetical protein